MKETIRHILSGTLFLGLLAGMLLGLNFLFRPKDKTEAAGFHYPGPADIWRSRRIPSTC